MSSKELHNGKCVIFSAPSGAGKTTIVHHLLQQDLGLEFSISATSREARTKERDGKDYHYMSVEEFENRVKNDEFIEWEEVYERQYYGTLESEIVRIWNKHNHVIFDVDVQGGINLKKRFGAKALSIFVKPPSIEKLEERLKGRDTETEESIRKRMDKASKEMEFKSSFDYELLNDDLDTAKNEAYTVVKEFLNQS